MYMQCERAWQKMSRVFYALRQNMSRVFARDFGERCCEHHVAVGHTAEQTIPSPLTFDNAS